MCLEDFSTDFRSFNSFDKRLMTFRNWKGSQDSTEMARAGFFFSGRRDITICFVCGVEIFGWLPNDIPIEEHLRLSKNCYYAKLIQSKESTDMNKVRQELYEIRNLLESIALIQDKKANTLCFVVKYFFIFTLIFVTNMIIYKQM